MHSVDGLPAFTVKVILSEPPADMQQRVKARKQSDIDEFSNFQSQQAIYEQDNKLIDSGFGANEPAIFEDRGYLLVNAEIVDGPESFNNYIFKYPIKLTGLDFSTVTYVINDLGLVPDIGSPHLKAIEQATDAVEDLLTERNIKKYHIVFQVFHNGQQIAKDQITID